MLRRKMTPPYHWWRRTCVCCIFSCRSACSIRWESSLLRWRCPLLIECLHRNWHYLAAPPCGSGRCWAFRWAARADCCHRHCRYLQIKSGLVNGWSCWIFFVVGWVYSTQMQSWHVRHGLRRANPWNCPHLVPSELPISTLNVYMLRFKIRSS